MNENTLIWAYKPESPEDSEMIQRVAYTFGYTWKYSPVPSYCTAPFICFNPIDMRITYGVNEESMRNAVKEIVTSSQKALDFLKNPPKEPEFLLVGDFKLYKDGSVEGSTNGKMTTEEFDKLNRKRDEYLDRGNMTKYPLISFSYRKDDSDAYIYRQLLVVKADVHFVEGYELVGVNKVYKRFLYTKMEKAPVFLGMEFLTSKWNS